MITRFRKRPVVIDAMLLDLDSVNDVIWWIKSGGGKAHRNVRRSDHAIVVVIETLEGDMAADLGDWVIKGVENEFYACKPAIFEKTYEPAGELDG